MLWINPAAMVNSGYKQLRGRKVYLACTSRSQSVTEGKSGQRKLKGGSWKQELKQKSQGMLFTGLLPVTC